MADESNVLAAEVNTRFIRAREAITTARRSLDQADGIGTTEQYEARAINHRTELDHSLPGLAGHDVGLCSAPGSSIGFSAKLGGVWGCSSGRSRPTHPLNGSR